MVNRKLFGMRNSEFTNAQFNRAPKGSASPHRSRASLRGAVKREGYENAGLCESLQMAEMLPRSAFRIPHSEFRIRAAFSLIELLVVIGIITFLTAATAVVAIRFIGTARVKASQTTIKKVGELLSSRINDLERFIDKENRSAGANLPSYAQNFLAAAGGNRQAALVLGRKDLFRRNFPQRFVEDTQATASGFDASKHQPETESAEVLYYLLSNAPSFGTETDDLSHFTSSEIADTDGDGLLEFVDAWGNPLRFYRWPTRLIRPAAAGVESSPGARPILINTKRAARFLINRLPDSISIGRDSDDPLGVVNPVKPPATDNDLTAFENQIHTANTWHVPLIVSAGPDEELGLFEPNDTTNFGTLAQPKPDPPTSNAPNPVLFDNITNLSQQAGGN